LAAAPLLSVDGLGVGGRRSWHTRLWPGHERGHRAGCCGVHGKFARLHIFRLHQLISPLLYIVFNFRKFSGQGHQGKDDELGTFEGNDLAPLEKFLPPGKLQSIYCAKLLRNISTFLRYNI
jgi:hypothetical protein